MRPEHTRASYELAIGAGADYIEPDVVATADGVLVVRHENEISGTTDIADHDEFANRYTSKTVDGERLTGWFTEDFTVAELQTLTARERIPQIRPANTGYDGQQSILTFAELLQIVERANMDVGTEIGVYVETKHPSYFSGLGISLNELLINDLSSAGFNSAAGFNGGHSKVVIQSFESSNLSELRTQTSAFLVQLLKSSGAPADIAAHGYTYEQLSTHNGLNFIAGYADAIGPNKQMVLDWNDDDTLGASTGLVERAHAAGLDVHIWTLRDENVFLPADLRWGEDPADHGNISAELWAYWDEGVDGVFVDFTTSAVVARDDWLNTRRHWAQ